MTMSMRKKTAQITCVFIFYSIKSRNQQDQYLFDVNSHCMMVHLQEWEPSLWSYINSIRSSAHKIKRPFLQCSLRQPQSCQYILNRLRSCLFGRLAKFIDEDNLSPNIRQKSGNDLQGSRAGAWQWDWGWSQWRNDRPC